MVGVVYEGVSRLARFCEEFDGDLEGFIGDRVLCVPGSPPTAKFRHKSQFPG